MNNVDLSLVKELREKTSISMSQCIKALGESDNNLDAAIVLLKTWGALKGASKAGKLALEGKIVACADNKSKIAAIAELNCETDFGAKSEPFSNLCNEYIDHMVYPKDMKIEEKVLDVFGKIGENVVIRRHDKIGMEDIRNEHQYYTAYTHPGDKLAVIVEFSLGREIATHDADFQAFADDVAMQIAANAPVCVNAGQIPSTMVVEMTDIVVAQIVAAGTSVSREKILAGKMGKWRSEIVLLEQPCLKEPKITIDQKRQSLEKTLGCEIMINRFVRYALGETSPKAEEKDLAADVSALISGGN